MKKEEDCRSFGEHRKEDDGTTAVVRTEHMPAEDVEYMRSIGERWMKIRHTPAVSCHAPWFVVRHALQMLAHTFRRSTIRSGLGLESSRKAFQPDKAIRRQKRE
jgi:anaerobic magnesium-protoporphyrin IX monomethyl ester cyclase